MGGGGERRGRGARGEEGVGGGAKEGGVPQKDSSDWMPSAQTKGTCLNPSGIREGVRGRGGGMAEMSESGGESGGSSGRGQEGRDGDGGGKEGERGVKGEEWCGGEKAGSNG